MEGVIIEKKVDAACKTLEKKVRSKKQTRKTRFEKDFAKWTAKGWTWNAKKLR